MYLYRSNRTEKLVDALADVLREPLDDPFQPEWIVVQGRGMERWLALELARRFGIWANAQYPFPRRLVEVALQSTDPDSETANLFSPERLLWAIAELLPSLIAQPEMAPIRSYLTDDTGGLKLLQLAERIARTFDQYVVFRPEMIEEWNGGKDEGWQSTLWRALIARFPQTHVAARIKAFLTTPGEPPAGIVGLPRRVCLFGLSTLAPIYLQVLESLSQRIDVHAFVLTPSSEYWADLRSRRGEIRDLLRRPDLDLDALRTTFHRARGPLLLASLGRLGADFQMTLEDRTNYDEQRDDLYEDPGEDTLLHTLQSDMLHLRVRGENEEISRTYPSESDVSIRVHSCHSPLREVEVLYDQLRAMFDDDPSLPPHDVIVMAPSIDAYAPYIQAVFGGAVDEGARRGIPFSVGDRRVTATDEVVSAVLRILELAGSRMPASSVIDLLTLAPVREKFDLSIEDLDRIRTWIEESGIRWGIDSAHRESAGQPGFPENTWHFGLRRLLLGHAIGGEHPEIFRGVLPYDDLEGTVTAVLGRFVDFCEGLFSVCAEARTATAIEVWAQRINAILESLVSDEGGFAEQQRMLRETVQRMVEAAADASFQQDLGLDAMTVQLARALGEVTPSRGFLTGGVTFCELVPMRSIPFEVVCLIGMSDGALPRAQHPPSFDLMAAKPQIGDRSGRDDDRYLFLEAILSARSRLLLTYVGHSLADNAERPPSVLVSDLLDAVDETVGPAANETESWARTNLVIHHPLQAFSPRYFDQQSPELFNYSAAACEGARRSRGERVTPAPFVCSEVAQEVDGIQGVTLRDLEQFFRNPVKSFVEQRLGIRLPDRAGGPADREPLDLDSLDQWKIGDEYLDELTRGAPPDVVRQRLRTAGLLPPGELGEALVSPIEPEVGRIVSRAAQWRGGARLDPLCIEGDCADVPLSAVLRQVWPTAQVEMQFSRLGGHQELHLWLRHLFLCWKVGPRVTEESILIGRPPKDSRNRIVCFRPVEDASSHLQDLLVLYHLGAQLPLPFFPRASRAYVEALDDGKPPEAAIAAARKVWNPEFVDFRERDAWAVLVFGERDPLDERTPLFPDARGTVPGFAEIASRVFRPLLQHREECP